MQEDAASPLHRAAFGLTGLAVAAVACWLSFFALFLIDGPSCKGPHGSTEALEIALFGAAVAGIATVPWLLAVSLLRDAAGRRWLRGRSWIGAPLIVMAVAAPWVAIEAVHTPSPSPTCQPLTLD